MKKFIKYLTLSFILVFTLLNSCACSRDNMDNIDIIVTNYSNEYITKMLYGNHSTITSIYPDGVDINSYIVSDKQKNEYAKKDLFIYNGLIKKERDLAVDLLERNSNLKIIDAAYVLETEYSPEELWLNPSSLLMMAQNIRLGLEEYVSSTYLKKEIDTAYNDLKVLLSELDADYRLTIENTQNKTIVVDSQALNFLSKFGLNVMCTDDTATDKVISDIESLIQKGAISYIFIFKNSTPSENTKILTERYTNIKMLELHKLDNISDSERADKRDYLSLSNDNLNNLKQELYQ